MPQKMRHAALRSALSALARDWQLIFVDQIVFDSPKTKYAQGVVKALVGAQRVLILVPGRDEMVERGLRNLPNVMTLHASYINVRDLLRFERVVISSAALDVIKGLLGKPARDGAVRQEAIGAV